MANHRRITEEQEREIEKMSKDGHAASVVARSLELPYDTVLRTMRRMGLPVSRSSRRSGLSSKEVSMLVQEYQEGVSTENLGEAYGVSAATAATYVREAGVALRPAGFRRGADHHKWNGGKTIGSQGYVLVRLYPDDPFFGMAQEKAEGASYVLEHRLVMARSLGRPLEEHETVHHVDGNKQNNDRSNLQLRQGRHGKGSVLVCADCGSHNLIHAPLESN